jgi:hypothetical protein
VDAYFREALRVSEPKAPKVTLKTAVLFTKYGMLYMELFLEAPISVDDTQTITLK